MDHCPSSKWFGLARYHNAPCALFGKAEHYRGTAHGRLESTFDGNLSLTNAWGYDFA